MARQNERINVRIPVSLLIESAGSKVLHEASTVDLSQRGMRVRISIPLWPGQNIEVIPDDGFGKPVPGRVVWAHPSDYGRDGQAGLEFLSPLPVPA